VPCLVPFCSLVAGCFCVWAPAQLETALDALFVEVVDTTGGCSPQPSYRITVVSPQFTGKRMLQQHKLVYAALGDEMDNMHASILVTRTPEQHAA